MKISALFRRFGSFLRFSASSIVSFLVDYGLFTLLNAVVLAGMADGTREIAATYGARVVSAVVNFTLNKKLVFRSDGNGLRCALRYALLAVVQAGVSALLVSTLHTALGVSDLAETLIKLPVDVLLFLVSYNIQKKWVFAR